MFYTIYIITHKQTGKVYIGKHKTNNLDDGYMGSGKLIQRAIQKYGKEIFEKTILFVFNSQYDMDLKEKELVNESFVLSSESYNLCLGGKGGWDLEKAKVAFLGKNHTIEAKEKIGNFRRGKSPSIETRKKLSDAQKGIPRLNVSLKLKNKPKTEEHKRKISETLKRKYLARMESGAIGSANDSES